MKLKQRELLYELLKGYPKYINEIEMNGVDNLKPESIEKILDILLTVFTNYGLDDDEPNKYGLEIEDLIDIVNDAE
ncbi:hypothetical protein HB848_08670 [Listeria rocourtiae]|uniref:hypothetical protein n=1 Tax=Listeria rocourtiae TaxID=647910 RepID=UPI001623A3DB|nr:hypothetical protein [Listeria rocourtiae]MBC1435410.1 hypothetical protein [Listeria rocourtiae]